MTDETSLQSTNSVLASMGDRRLRKILVRLILASALILLTVYLLLAHLVGSVSYPPSGWLGQWYFDAVVSNDAASAASLLATCNKKTADQSVQPNTAKFGGAETRGLNVTVKPGTGSSDTFETIKISFEYRKPGMADWQPGSIWLWSDYQPFHLRYLCDGP